MFLYVNTYIFIKYILYSKTSSTIIYDYIDTEIRSYSFTVDA